MTVKAIYKLYDRKAPDRELLEAFAEVPLDDRDDNFHDRTALHLAAEQVDVEAIELLLMRGAEVDVRDAQGHTPLHALAVVRGERTFSGERICRAARLLLEQGASVTRSARDTTALIEAVRNRHHRLVELLLRSTPHIDSTDRNGENALHVVCRIAGETTAYLSRLEWGIAHFADTWVPEKRKEETLCERDEQCAEAARCYTTAALLLADGRIDPDEKNNSGKTPFDLAMEGGAKPLSALLSGKDPASGEPLDETGGMDIFQALYQKDMQALEALLRYGVELQTECGYDKMIGFYGKSPLACALSWQNVEAAAMLLRGGADPNYRNSQGETAFVEWFDKGCRHASGVEAFGPLLNLFLEKGWNPHAPVNGKGDTALALVCRNNNDDLSLHTLRILLGLGVDVNARDSRGRVPLMHLFERRHCCSLGSEMEELLLEAGADVRAVDAEGNTILHYIADCYSHIEAKRAAQMLFDFGSPPVVAVNNAGETSLDVAIRRDNEPLVKFLLKYT